MSIVVMVDSYANLSKAMLKKYKICLLPYNIMFKDKNIIDVNKFENIDSEKVENHFRKYIDRGDDILYIGVSSHLSNSYNDVVEVSKKFDPSTIEIIDSLNIGAGEALLALYARDYIDKGYGLKQTAKYLNNIKRSESN